MDDGDAESFLALGLNELGVGYQPVLIFWGHDGNELSEDAQRAHGLFIPLEVQLKESEEVRLLVLCEAC